MKFVHLPLYVGASEPVSHSSASHGRAMQLTCERLASGCLHAPGRELGGGGWRPFTVAVQLTSHGPRDLQQILTNQVPRAYDPANSARQANSCQLSTPSFGCPGNKTTSTATCAKTS